jgi:hypothetical protein
MSPDILDILLLLFGSYFLVGVIFKPGIFWERGRILRTRDTIGDQKTLIMYAVLSLVMIGVGLWGSFQ